jgi:hypothetical protein
VTTLTWADALTAIKSRSKFIERVNVQHEKQEQDSHDIESALTASLFIVSEQIGASEYTVHIAIQSDQIPSEWVERMLGILDSDELVEAIAELF